MSRPRKYIAWQCGTVESYNIGCRCAPCKQAAAIARKAVYVTRREQLELTAAAMRAKNHRFVRIREGMRARKQNSGQLPIAGRRER